MNTSPIPAHGQQFVSATVYLAGDVETETAHATWTHGAGHVMARIGGMLLYFLDRASIAGFATAAREAGSLGEHVFHDGHRRDVHVSPAGAQEASIVLRLRGAQDVGRPHALTAGASPDGAPFVSLRVGGLTMVLRDQVALAALVQVTTTALRAADILWPDEDADLQLRPARVDVHTR